MKAVLQLLSILILASCNLVGESANTILKEIPNQNQSKKAILFLKDGGATAASSYQLTISGIAYKLNVAEVGNTFIADDDHGAGQLDSSSILLSWISNDSLKVTYDRKLRTFLQKSEINGVYILYDLK